MNKTQNNITVIVNLFQIHNTWTVTDTRLKFISPQLSSITLIYKGVKDENA
jgi:hypothetical protein